MIWIALGAAVAVIGMFIAALYWLATARYNAGRAEAEAASLKRGREARSQADEIMAEPTGDERAWADRLRHRRDYR